MVQNQSLYDEVVTVTAEYLGPAADRFVVRQIRNHLDKDPAKLQRKDLQQLIEWIQLAMRLISDDAAIVDRYVADLKSLTITNAKSLSRHGKTATH